MIFWGAQQPGHDSVQRPLKQHVEQQHMDVFVCSCIIIYCIWHCYWLQVILFILRLRGGLKHPRRLRRVDSFSFYIPGLLQVRGVTRVCACACALLLCCVHGAQVVHTS
jgi:hypothetical protein